MPSYFPQTKSRKYFTNEVMLTEGSARPQRKHAKPRQGRMQVFFYESVLFAAKAATQRMQDFGDDAFLRGQVRTVTCRQNGETFRKDAGIFEQRTNTGSTHTLLTDRSAVLLDAQTNFPALMWKPCTQVANMTSEQTGCKWPALRASSLVSRSV